MDKVVKFAVSVVASMMLMGATEAHIENALGAIFEGIKDKCPEYTLTRFIGEVFNQIKTQTNE